MSQNRAFLSYAHQDLEMVRRLHAGLEDRGVDVWFDKEDLRIGAWKPQIERAIARSRYFIICLSDAALRQTGDEPGFQDHELHTAYNIAQAQSASSFTIIPVRLEECGRGDHRTSPYQQLDLFTNWDGVLDRLAVELGGRALGATLVPPTDEERAHNQLVGKAITFYYAGDHEKALKVWESIALLGGDSYDSWFWKGMSLDETGRLDEALHAYQAANAADPERRGALNNLGVVLTKLGRHAEAIDHLDALLQRDPGYSVAWYNKALALDKLGRRPEARACLEQLFAVHPEREAEFRKWGGLWSRFEAERERIRPYWKQDDVDPFEGGPGPVPA